MSPVGFEHGVIAGRIYGHLLKFLEEHRLGMVTGAATGFQIGHDPDSVRAPDVGFICADRVPKGRIAGFFQGAPDIAVEVVSPTDRAGELLAKVQDWLAAGCQVVWVVDPTPQTVTIYRTARTTQNPTTDNGLLPGFRLPVAEIFG